MQLLSAGVRSRTNTVTFSMLPFTVVGGPSKQTNKQCGDNLTQDSHRLVPGQFFNQYKNSQLRGHVLGLF